MQQWVKMGNILSPKEFGLEYAAVPVLNPQDNNLTKRAIYFTDRIKGKSHILRGILNLETNTIEKNSISTILKPGKSGFFDEDGVMTSSIIFFGGKFLLYYTGWSLTKSVPFRNALGLAISEDNGQTFNKISQGPVLDRSIYDPCFVSTADGIVENGKLRLWYISGLEWIKNKNVFRPQYHIKYAESADGIIWHREGKVCIDFKNKFEYVISTPRVIKLSGTYRMWYSYRGSKNYDRYRIGYAESENGISWIRKDENINLTVSESDWDSQMLEYPFVFKHAEKLYMLYNGNDYGKTGFGIAKLINKL